MEVPHSRCNWLIESRILIGARPIPSTIESILQANVRIFVNLENSSDSRWYESLILERGGIVVYYLPTPSGQAPPEDQARQLVQTLVNIYWTYPQYAMYIHCRGGHGRSAVIGALVYGTLMRVSAGDAIQWVIRSRENRPDTSRNFIPTPETNAQVQLIARILGVSPEHPLPDRSSREWMKRVRRDRGSS